MFCYFVVVNLERFFFYGFFVFLYSKKTVLTKKKQTKLMEAPSALYVREASFQIYKMKMKLFM